jgi:hypothetical protein
LLLEQPKFRVILLTSIDSSKKHPGRFFYQQTAKKSSCLENC